MVVHAANIQDRDGAQLVITKLVDRFPRLVLIWADGGYAGQLVEWLWHLRHYRRLRLEVVRRGADQRGTSVLPKRWIVEQTFGWLMKHRRLRCDYEQLTVNSETMIYIAMTRLMLRRLYP